MGEVVEFGGRRSRNKAPVPAPKDVVSFTKQHLGELIELSGRALSNDRMPFGFNERLMPELNFGYVANANRSNYIGLMVAKRSVEVNVAVTDKFALHPMPPSDMLDDYGQIGAEALFAVSYGLATHAAKRSSHVHSRGFNEDLWRRAELPHPKSALSLRAAGAIVAAHFEFVGVPVDELRSELSQAEVVPAHFAAMVNPLDITLTRQLFGKLAC